MAGQQPPSEPHEDDASSAPNAGQGYVAISYLIGGMVVWGGIGWLIDLWLDTTFVKAIGVLVGLATSIYLVVVKYGNTG